jgi:hypothetical protein
LEFTTLGDHGSWQQIGQNRQHDCDSRSNVQSFHQDEHNKRDIQISSIPGKLSAILSDNPAKFKKKRTIRIKNHPQGDIEEKYRDT